MRALCGRKRVMVHDATNVKEILRRIMPHSSVPDQSLRSTA